MKKILTIALLFIITPAIAQQPTAIDRIAGSLGQCISVTEQRVDQMAELQKQLAAAQERIKELEAKKEKPGE